MSPRDPLIAVTGATGTIPRTAVSELLRAGKRARLLARDPSRAPAGAASVTADLSRPDTLGPALAGVDTLVLVTGATPDLVTQHRSVLEAARAAGVRKVVRVSAWGADPTSSIGLGRWHGELDAAFQASGLVYVSLQPHGFQQNTLGYADPVKREGAVYAPLGQGRVCYVDARDIGAVAAAVATTDTWDGETLELTGPAAFSYAELAATLGEALGRTVKYVDTPPATVRQVLLGGGWPAWLVDDLLALSQLYAANLASTPTDTVARVLGRPATDLARFFADHRAVFTP